MDNLELIICTTSMASIAITAFATIPFILVGKDVECCVKFENYRRVAEFLQENTDIREYELGVKFHPKNAPRDTFIPVFYRGKIGYLKLVPEKNHMISQAHDTMTYFPKEFIQPD